jgi:hypothetical protein
MYWYAQNVTQPFSLRVGEMLTKLLGIFRIDLDVKEGLLIRYSSFAIRAREGKEYQYDKKANGLRGRVL